MTSRLTIKKMLSKTTKNKFLPVLVFPAIVFFGLLGCRGGLPFGLSNSSENGGSQLNGNAPDEKTVTVLAGDLIKEYRENPAAADEKYKGKLMTVGGEINGLIKSPGYNWISVRGSGNFSSSDPNPLGIGCIFADPEIFDSEKTEISQKVVVVGRNDGMQKAKMIRDGEYVTLQDCRIEDKISLDDLLKESKTNKTANMPATERVAPDVPLPDASDGKLPTGEEIQSLLRKTMRDLADAIESEDFTKFKATLSKGAISYRTSAENLKSIYGGKWKLEHLRASLGTKPTFSANPFVATYKLTESGKPPVVYPAINLRGSYKNAENSMDFDVQYLAEGKDWKVSIFNFIPRHKK